MHSIRNISIGASSRGLSDFIMEVPKKGIYACDASSLLKFRSSHLRWLREKDVIYPEKRHPKTGAKKWRRGENWEKVVQYLIKHNL